MKQEKAENRCPLCKADNFEIFLRAHGMPAQDGVLYTTRSAAVTAQRGDIELAFCSACQYVGNATYDPGIISFTNYSYSKYQSPQYREHVKQLVELLVREFKVRDKKVLEVGCGEGYFLRQLCAAGDNTGVGIDPSLPEQADAPQKPQELQFISALYTEEHAAEPFDLVCCRHVLDEIFEPLPLLKLMTGEPGIAHRELVYIELPNAWITFEKQLIWNLGYAKRSWFNSAALSGMLQRCGLEILRQNLQFGGEYIGIVARRSRRPKSEPKAADPARSRETLISFAKAYEEEMRRWEKRLTDFKRTGKQYAIWGAGMRGINFLHRFGEREVFPIVVDISSDRQGKYLPGSGYRVEAPTALLSSRTEHLLVSNPNYFEEIRDQVDQMGLHCTIECL